ncbi:putative RNA polymerase II subunit B1 CTD phosphatase rpap2 [Ciona intestinalis]
MGDTSIKNKQKFDKQVLADARKKLLAEKRAQAIVEQLVESNVSEDLFQKSVYYLSVDRYADVVEERSITKICGYPVCPNSLQNIPRQQYKISNNVVYDITERKKFCSNVCYQSSKFIQEQIPTYPLWLRETDDKVRITLLKIGSGSKGEKVDLVHFVQPSDAEVESEFKDESHADQADATHNSSADDNCREVRVTRKKTTCLKLCDPPKGLGLATRHNEKRKVDLDELVGLFGEWVTRKTLVRLKLLPEDDTPVAPVNANEQRRAAKMKLLEERMNKIAGGKQVEEKQPLPSYEEVNEYGQRVDQYFRGQFTAVQGRHVMKPKKKKSDEEEDFTSQHVVPAVDSKNQLSIRKRIIMEKFSKSLSTIDPTMHNPSILQDIRCVVDTFNLTNKNVMLKPDQHVVVTLMILELLQRSSNFSNTLLSSSVSAFLKSISLEIEEIKTAVEHIVEKIVSRPP